MERTLKKILVASRGLPAVRIVHACRDRKISTVAVYSAPDRLSYHVHLADSAAPIGEASPEAPYSSQEKIIEAALGSGTDAVHPGWGPLAENTDFAQKVLDAGLTWIGPKPEVIRLAGDQIETGKMAERAKIPVVPSLTRPQDLKRIQKWMDEEKIQFPIQVKAAASGQAGEAIRVESEAELTPAVAKMREEAMKACGDEAILVEKYVEGGRHIKVQVLGDNHGHCIHLFERECTLRHAGQKIIEEAPSPRLDQDLRQEMCAAAVRLMREIGYDSAGTVEFLFDPAAKKYYLHEVHPRLQDEHGLTELVTGLDMAGLMLDVAQGRELPFEQKDVHLSRRALGARLYAQDPRTFTACCGRITRLLMPLGPNVRVAACVSEGSNVPLDDDSLLMLLMTSGADRLEAVRVMDRALERDLRVEGVLTLAPLLLSIIRHPAFIQGVFSNRFIEEHMEELAATFMDRTSEDEALKIARYVAEATVLGPAKWV